MRDAPAVPAGSVYVHVPFCSQKCEYCAFYSTAGDASLIQRYVDALVRDLAARRDAVRKAPDTLFFGGGTPSLLNLRQWQAVLETFQRLGWSGAGEWTVECNPATVSADKARLLREGGVNRISMGVQSLDERLLDRLGRVHTRDMVFRSYDILRNAGFQRINLDLMFGIPGQTLDIWRATLDEVMAMGSEHLSCYEVIYEEDTPLFEQMKAGEFDVDEALNAGMFDLLVERAESAGFRQYEVANFALDPARDGGAAGGNGGGIGLAGVGLPGEACRHNVNYWRGGDYVAFGPSASGYEGGWRYRNVANTTRYCECVEQGASAVEWEERLSPRARAGEIAAFGLRMNTGWAWDDFVKATGFDLREGWGGEMERLVAEGWGERGDRGFRLTRRGLRFADAAGAEFLRPDEGTEVRGVGARGFTGVRKAPTVAGHVGGGS